LEEATELSDELDERDSDEDEEEEELTVSCVGTVTVASIAPSKRRAPFRTKRGAESDVLMV
jgi:hypothetical protein